MYHLYHTKTFVLGGAPFGEANTFFTLFTRELGMITASATSVREERSKLRYGLQDFSYSRITLVRGKETWRLASAELIENLCTAFQMRPEVVRMFARVFRLLRRLLPPEEKNERLFEAVEGAFFFLKEGISLRQVGKGEKIPHPLGPLPLGKGEYKPVEIEIVLVLRILYLLGYLAPRGEFESVLSDVLLWDDSQLSLARSLRARALASINESLRASQL